MSVRNKNEMTKLLGSVIGYQSGRIRGHETCHGIASWDKSRSTIASKTQSQSAVGIKGLTGTGNENQQEQLGSVPHRIARARARTGRASWAI